MSKVYALRKKPKVRSVTVTVPRSLDLQRAPFQFNCWRANRRHTSRSTEPVGLFAHISIRFFIVPIRDLITNFIGRNKERNAWCASGETSLYNSRRVAWRWARFHSGHSRSSREMRHGKRLLKASTRVRGMETVLSALKDLTVLDGFFHLGVTHRGVLQ